MTPAQTRDALVRDLDDLLNVRLADYSDRQYGKGELSAIRDRLAALPLGDGEPVANMIVARRGDQAETDIAALGPAFSLQPGDYNLYLAPPQPEGWQPIETAPKDGTVIDVWTRSGRIADVFWSRDFTGGVPAFCVRHYDKRYGWVNRMVEKPTHWTPLLAAPGGKEGG